MREILFRGKRSDNGEWIYGDLLQPTDVVGCTEISENIGVSIRYDVIPETVGQYTGLKDKNGVKIFEGDIVTLNGNKEPLCVEFSEFMWQASKKEKCYKHRLENNSAKYEVIGNIHDNPDLMEETP